jgi:hypothetical protein
MLAASLQAQVLNIADVFNSTAVPQLFRFNSFPSITELPKIVPGQIQTPSLKEVALVLRAMGLNIAGDQKIQNYFRYLMGMPELTEKEFKEIYEIQVSASKDEDGNANNNTRTAGNDANANRNPGTRDLEQNDMNYTGGEM